MSRSIAFSSLAGIEPGVTTVSQVLSQYGPPDKKSYTKPCSIIEDCPGGDLCWEYVRCGVKIYVHRDDLALWDPKVEEVHVRRPYSAGLPCGLRLGQSSSEARERIARYFEVTDEYEDAIYFVPHEGRALIASVENWDGDEYVSSMELMWTEEGRQMHHMKS